MNILRKTVLVLAVTLLPIALFGFGLSWSLHQVFGTPTHIEHALTTSGIYNSVVGNALNQAQEKQQGEPGASNGSSGDNNVPFTQPAIRSVIEKAFPPEFLQTQTNGVLDNTYRWLQGKQPNLGFTIDLTSAKASLANGIGDYVQKQLGSLPTCAADQIPSNGDVDPFNATCVPKGFDIGAAAAKAKNQIMNGDFLKDTQLTPATIKNGQGKTLDQQLQQAPKAYQHTAMGIYAMGAVALLLSVGTLLLSATWRNGVRKLASVYVSVGAITALLAWGISAVLNKASVVLAKNSTGNKALQQSLLDVVKLLAKDLQSYWLTYGIILLALGVAGFVLLICVRAKQPGNSDQRTAEAAMPAAKTETTEQPTSKSPSAKEPRQPRKVQG